MIDLTGCVSIPYFKKTVFTGSDGKMRYLLGKAEENEETVLKAWYWEGPYASMYVPEEKKTAAVFPFSEEGIRENEKLTEDEIKEIDEMLDNIPMSQVFGGSKVEK